MHHDYIGSVELTGKRKIALAGWLVYPQPRIQKVLGTLKKFSLKILKMHTSGGNVLAKISSQNRTSAGKCDSGPSQQLSGEIT